MTVISYFFIVTAQLNLTRDWSKKKIGWIHVENVVNVSATKAQKNVAEAQI